MHIYRISVTLAQNRLIPIFVPHGFQLRSRAFHSLYSPIFNYLKIQPKKDIIIASGSAS